MEYDFIVGFTLFNTTGFKTRFKHFDNLKEAIMFTNNVDLKDNSKIYVDLKYLQDKIEDILNSELYLNAVRKMPYFDLCKKCTYRLKFKK